MPQPVDDLRCETVLDLIESFVDDSLEEDVGRRVGRHLDCCPGCSREEDAARQVLTELRSLPALVPPTRVMERVATEIDNETVPRAATFTIRRMGWLAAAAAAVLAIGTLTTSRQQQPAAFDAEALRAAAEVTWALAMVGDITQRANHAVKTEVFEHRVIPVTVRSFTRPFQRFSHDHVFAAPPAESPTYRLEGSS